MHVRIACDGVTSDAWTFISYAIIREIISLHSGSKDTPGFDTFSASVFFGRPMILKLNTEGAPMQPIFILVH